MTKKVVLIGGGTGTSTLLKGLRKNPDLELYAVVAMSDDGGSTGILRRELDLLPMGDIRQCILALLEDDALGEHFNYRFSSGTFKGHSVGNLLIGGINKSTGSLSKTIDVLLESFCIKGKVIPVTLEKHELHIRLKDGTLLKTENVISDSNLSFKDHKEIYLHPRVKANPRAVTAILNADLIVIGPGGLYHSLIPALLPEGIRESLIKSKAVKIYISNLVNKKGQNEGYILSDYLNELTNTLRRDIFDKILVDSNITDNLDRVIAKIEDSRIVKCDLLGKRKEKVEGDIKPRNVQLHDPDKSAKAIATFL